MRKREEAISLVEVLIATSILAFLMTVVYFIFYKGTFAWDKGSIRLQMYQNARSSLDIMKREIEVAFISPGDSSLIFRGEKNSLDYISASNKVKKSKQYDLCRIRYYLKEKNLLREVKTFLDNEKHGGAGVIASDVLNLDFSYYNGYRWQKNWDSTAGTPDDTADDSLPSAVRISITLRDKEAKEKPATFSTIITLPIGR